MERFGRTLFLPEHFVESVPFDRFEVEFLKERGGSRDPEKRFFLKTLGLFGGKGGIRRARPPHTSHKPNNMKELW